MESNNEREILAVKFDRHVEEESNVLGEYRALSEKLGDGPIGFLIDLILTEEEQHHFLLSTMTKWLRESPAEEKSVGLQGVNREELLQHTEKLRKHEQESIDAYRNLKSQLSGEDRELLDSLLDGLILDSEKHDRLLLAIEKMIKV
ncbi:MAG: hypothetical protein V3W37_04200 [Candidatus Binatia bacterium]